MKLIQATTLFLLGSSASAKSSIRKLQTSTVAATEPAGPEAEASLFGSGSTVAAGPTEPAVAATEPAFGGPTEPATGSSVLAGVAASEPAFGGPTEPATGTTGSATTEGSWIPDSLSNVTDGLTDIAGNATEGFNDWLDSVSAPDDDAGEVEATPYGLSNTTGEPGTDFGSSDDVVPSGDVPSSATLRFVSVSVLGAYAVSAIASL